MIIPGTEEHDFDAILYQWQTYHEYAGQLRIRGRIYADVRPQFVRGEWVVTSELQTIENNIAVTKSGTRYLLV